ncbi:MAG: hypothetical protein JRD89_09085 [Deltaproteobacteria bacterium]|nr:hypothetical protein [Deltaproteobacteria bacterium]
MDIRITPWDALELDLRTVASRGASTAIRSCSDPDTEVYYGNLYASVTMLDIGIKVIMGSVPGDWKSTVWARKTAWITLLAALEPQDLRTILDRQYEAGKREGVSAAQLRIRGALGIEDTSK